MDGKVVFVLTKASMISGFSKLSWKSDSKNELYDIRGIDFVGNVVLFIVTQNNLIVSF